MDNPKQEKQVCKWCEAEIIETIARDGRWMDMRNRSSYCHNTLAVRHHEPLAEPSLPPEKPQEPLGVCESSAYHYSNEQPPSPHGSPAQADHNKALLRTALESAVRLAIMRNNIELEADDPTEEEIAADAAGACFGEECCDNKPIPEVAELIRFLSAPAQAEVKRVIDGKFHIQNNEIVKTSSGEVVPEWEPLVLQRGRDHLMLPTLRYYRELSVQDGCNEYHLQKVDELIAKFEQFTKDHPEWMKQPGITKGAPFIPTAPQGAQEQEKLIEQIHNLLLDYAWRAYSRTELSRLADFILKREEELRTDRNKWQAVSSEQGERADEAESQLAAAQKENERLGTKFDEILIKQREENISLTTDLTAANERIRDLLTAWAELCAEGSLSFKRADGGPDNIYAEFSPGNLRQVVRSHRLSASTYKAKAERLTAELDKAQRERDEMKRELHDQSSKKD